MEHLRDVNQKLGKLKRVAFGVIAHSLTPAEIRTLREEFQNVDVEGRGEIRPADLFKALNKSDNYTKEEVEKLFEQIDLDHDGTIGGVGARVVQDTSASGFSCMDSPHLSRRCVERMGNKEACSATNSFRTFGRKAKLAPTRINVSVHCVIRSRGELMNT